MGVFFIHPGIRVKSRHLIDETSLKFVVCWLFLFYVIKKKGYGKAQAKQKAERERYVLLLCCEILYQFLAD